MVMRTILLDTSIDYTSWDISEAGSIKMTEWQPIETAPKDGSAILIWPAQSALTGSTECMIISYVVRWHDWKEAWIEASGEEYDTFYPTHWMPLPPPPKKGDE
jgi:hypothetical protein